MTLISAAAKGQSQSVKDLLTGGTNPNCIDYDSRSPLHLACAEGYVTIVEALLKAGATPDCKDRWGCTPLTEAMVRKHTAVIDMLTKAGAVDYGNAEHSNRSLHSDTDREPSNITVVDWADVKLLEKIGAGSFGVIYKCRWRGMLVAAKIIKSEIELDLGQMLDGNGSSRAAELRKAALEDFRHEIGFRAPEGDYETIGGVIMDALGHIPAEGESVDLTAFDPDALDDPPVWRATVAKMDGRRIDLLDLVRVTPSTKNGGRN
jgi:hypothetical protein